MQTTIVVATDFSAASATALRVAVDWARRLDARVVLTHALSHDGGTSVAPPDGAIPCLVPGTRLDRQGVLAWAERWAEAVRAEGVEAEVHVQAGDAHDVVLHAVQAYAAEAVVLGRQGLGRVRRVLMGSVTRAVLDRSRVPVTVVPA